jgi:hypothetical protein
MKVPAGWTFEVAEVNWRGLVDLDKNVRGVLAGQWFWRGEGQRMEKDKVIVKKVVDGPVSNNYLKHVDGEKDKKGVFMACTTKDVELNVNTVIRLQYGRDGRGGNGGRKEGGGGAGAAAVNNGKGSITVDSLDASFKQELKLNWKRC